jgi:hypothetical protein
MISRTPIAASDGDAGGSHLKDWTARGLFRAHSIAELKSVHELMSDEARDQEFAVSEVIVIWRVTVRGNRALPRGWHRQRKARNGIPSQALGRRLVAPFTGD